jgi:hypothetical protein
MTTSYCKLPPPTRVRWLWVSEIRGKTTRTMGRSKGAMVASSHIISHVSERDGDRGQGRHYPSDGDGDITIE